MAFRDTAHRARVIRSPEFQRMLRDFQRSPASETVPLHIFIRKYGEAFWDENGMHQEPRHTKKGRDAFMDIMHWSDRVDEDTDWDEFEERYQED